MEKVKKYVYSFWQQLKSKSLKSLAVNWKKIGLICNSTENKWDLSVSRMSRDLKRANASKSQLNIEAVSKSIKSLSDRQKY